MLTREIGSTGINASAVGLGTWAIGGWMWGGTDESAAVDAITASIAPRLYPHRSNLPGCPGAAADGYGVIGGVEALDASVGAATLGAP